MNGNNMDTIPNEINKLLTNVLKQFTDPPSNDDNREDAVIQPENDVGVGMSGVDVTFKDLTEFYTSAFSPLMSPIQGLTLLENLHAGPCSKIIV